MILVDVGQRRSRVLRKNQPQGFKLDRNRDKRQPLPAFRISRINDHIAL